MTQRRRGSVAVGGLDVPSLGSRRASSINFLTALPVPSMGARVNEGPDDKHQQQLLTKARQSLNRPVGILAVHVKHVNFINTNPTGAFTSPDVSVYLRILVGKQIKCTCEYEGVTAPTKVIMDELKHFNIQVSPKRSDPSNYMRMEVVAFEKENPKAHVLLAMKELHLFEIIKRLYAVENLEMYRVQKYVAEVDLEFCFSYGVFGYGYANQFENRQKTPKEQVQHSMFCREQPPNERVDGYRNIMLPRPVGHPGFIYFNKKVEIGDTVHRYRSDMSVHEWQTIEEPILLITRIRRKMHRLHSEYNEQPNRKARLEYLRNMMQNHAAQSNVNEGVMVVSDKFKLRRRQHRSLKMRPLEEADADDKLVYAKEDIVEMARVMEQAPGIVGRVRDVEHRQKVEEVVVEPPRARRTSVVKMIGDSISRVFGGIWRGNTEKDETPSSDTLAGVPRIVEPTSETSAKLDMDMMAEATGIVRRRPKPQQVSPGVVPEVDRDATNKAETPPTTEPEAPQFGQRLLDTHAVTDQRRSSTVQRGQSQAKRPSILESAATRIREMLAHKIEEHHEFTIPRVMVTPYTPEISDDDEDDDDYEW